MLKPHDPWSYAAIWAKTESDLLVVDPPMVPMLLLSSMSDWNRLKGVPIPFLDQDQDLVLAGRKAAAVGADARVAPGLGVDKAMPVASLPRDAAKRVAPSPVPLWSKMASRAALR